MTGLFWRLGLVSFLGLSSCRIGTGNSESKPTGIVDLLADIKPFSKMRSASELHAFRVSLINDLSLRSALATHKTPRNALQTMIMRQIIAMEGIPRTQIRAVLVNLLDSKSTACAGVPCARIFGLDSQDVDAFLDESLDNIEKIAASADKRAAKETLVASLLRNDAGPKSPWTIELVPDPDSALWHHQTPYSSALYPDFPLRAGEGQGISWSADFRASVVWGQEHEEQFKAWKKEFDSVDDCATRGVKRGKVYDSFNDCLAEASLEEQQFLSAKLVFDDVQAKLAKVDGKTNPRRHFRAVFDKDGHMQCLVVTTKMPSMSYYTSHYPGMVPKGASQIPALEVNYLLAAPWNLKQEHPKKVKGAGTACLGLAALESKRGPWGGRILLEGSPSAVPYYQKLGFVAVGEFFDKRYGLLPAMWLDPKHSEKLVPANLH